MLTLRRHARLVSLVAIASLAPALAGCNFLNGRNWTVAVGDGKTMVTTHRVETAMIVNILWPVFCKESAPCVIGFLADHTPEDPMRSALLATSTQQPIRESLEYTLFVLNRTGHVHVEQDPPSPCLGFVTTTSSIGWGVIPPRDDYGCLWVYPIDIS